MNTCPKQKFEFCHNLQINATPLFCEKSCRNGLNFKELYPIINKITPVVKTPEPIVNSTILPAKPEPPTLFQMTEHFAKSMAKWAKSDFKLVDKETYLKRREICNVCNGGWRCPICGCSLWAKAHLAGMVCDKNLWDSKISVIIPAMPHEQYLQKTIDSLIKNAVKELEIIIVADGWTPEPIDNTIIYSFRENMGERVTLNKGVDLASGTHILRIDAHCTMSENWDIELLKHCKKNVCISTLDALDENWNLKGHNYKFCYITPEGSEKWWSSYPENKNLDAEPTLSFTGCGWLCEKEFYQNHLRLDEDLAKWGGLGPEITMKAEKANSHLLLCKKVKCGHVFQANKKGYSKAKLLQTQLKLVERYGQYLYNTVKKFKNVPDWE